jgi:DNA-binding FadR family transcriptional regulator
MTARTAALVLQTRNVSLADVYDARSLLEPMAVRAVAESPKRKAAATELRKLIAAQEAVVDDPDDFGEANARFHERLVALAGNQTLSIVAEMLAEVVARAVTDAAEVPGQDSAATRRRGIKSQAKVVDLIAAGEAAEAEAHWRSHMAVVGRVLLGKRATTVIDLLDHY